MTRGPWLTAGLCLALGTVTCSVSNPTELLVVVTSDIKRGPLRGELHQVRIVAQREGGATPLVDRWYAVADGIDAGDTDGGTYALPGQLALLAASATDTRAVLLDVSADLGDGQLNFTQRAVVHFTPNQLTYVEIFLPERCSQQTNRDLCGPGYTCGEARCVLIDRTTSTAPPTPRDVPPADNDVLVMGTDTAVDAGTDASMDTPMPTDLPVADTAMDAGTDGGTDTGTNGDTDAGPPLDCPVIGTPQQIRPISGSINHGSTPWLVYTYPTGATYTEVESYWNDRTFTRTDDHHGVAAGTDAGTDPLQRSQLGNSVFEPAYAGVYFWRARGLNGLCAGPWSPIWQVVLPPRPPGVPLPDGGTSYARPDLNWGVIPDINGDQFADILVGSPSGSFVTGTGAVHVFNGSDAGIPDGQAAAQTLTAPPGEAPPIAASFGVSVVGAGDVDGDGYPDAIVASNGGVVFVYRGSTRGLITSPAARLVVGSGGGGATGLGDMDGDGYGDVAVPSGDAHQVTVFFGAPADATTGAIPLTRTRVFNSTDSTRLFPSSLAAAGDLDGDNRADLVVGAMANPAADASAPTGTAYVVWGSGSDADAGVSPLPATVFSGGATLPEWHFGSAVAGVGDINGDGYLDFAVGDPITATVSFFTTRGTRNIVLIGQVTQGVRGTGGFGTAVSGAGDLDGDGLDDVLVGAPGRNLAYAILGTAVTPFSPTVRTFPVGAAGAGMGTAVAGMGDVDNNSLADAVITAPGPVDAGAGTVQVYGTTRSTDWTSAPGPGFITLSPTTLARPTGLTGPFGRALGVGL